MEPRGLTLLREIGLLVLRQLSLHKLLLPVIKKGSEFTFMGRQEPGWRMLSKGWGEGASPWPLCESLPGAGPATWPAHPQGNVTPSPSLGGQLAVEEGGTMP